MAKKSKLPVTGGMKVRAYPLLVRAVEEGVEYGWRRAFKHTDTPEPDAIKDQIMTAVTNAICEYFDFDDDVREP